MESFETRVTIDNNTDRELKKYLKCPREKLRVAIMFVLLMLVGIFCLVMGNAIGFLVIAVAIVSLIMHHLNYLYVSKNNKKRQIESNGGKTEFDIIVSFSEDGITITNIDSNGTITVGYDIIKRFAETEHYFALFTKAHQHILVNRSQLVQEDKDESFLCFIKEKCKLVRWKK